MIIRGSLAFIEMWKCRNKGDWDCLCTRMFVSTEFSSSWQLLITDIYYYCPTVHLFWTEVNEKGALLFSSSCNLWGVLQIEDRFYIYLEYVHPGSINKYVKQHYGAMTESVIRNFTRHILRGLAFLHGQKIMHRYANPCHCSNAFFFVPGQLVCWLVAWFLVLLSCLGASSKLSQF